MSHFDQGSPPLAMSAYDWRKALRDALIALAGFGITYLIEVLMPDLEKSGVLTAAMVAVIVATLAALRRYLTDTRLLMIGFVLFCLGCTAQPSVAAPIVTGGPAATVISRSDLEVILIVTKSGCYELTVDAVGVS